MTKKELLVRSEETPTEYGKPPGERTIEGHLQKGIINLDKPPGPTSFQVTAYVK